ncbi:hypothetical protein V8C86DRAFT_2853626 [Haematococcus lacustris]
MTCLTGTSILRPCVSVRWHTRQATRIRAAQHDLSPVLPDDQCRFACTSQLQPGSQPKSSTNSFIRHATLLLVSCISLPAISLYGNAECMVMAATLRWSQPSLPLPAANILLLPTVALLVTLPIAAMVAQSAAVSTQGPATPVLLPAWDSATAALIAALVAGLFALIARALAAFRLTFPQASVPRVSAWAVSAGLAAAAACCVQGQDPCKPLSCCWSWLQPALPSSLLAYCASLLLEPALAVLFSHQHAAAPAGGAGTPPGYPNVHPPRPAAAAAASLHAGWRLRSAALPMPEAPLLTAPVTPPPAAPHGDTMLAGRLAWAAVRLALVSGWLRHVSQGSSSGPLAGGALAASGPEAVQGGLAAGHGAAVAWGCGLALAVLWLVQAWGCLAQLSTGGL